MNSNWENKFQDSIASAMGIVEYLKIMDEFNKNGITEKFKQHFKSFYVVRFNTDWQNAFFGYFEEILRNSEKKNIAYANVLVDLYERTHRVEASFSSKLITTIDPNMPIYDSQILEFMISQDLDIKPYSTIKEKQKDNAIYNYKQIQDWFINFKNSEEGKAYIKRFNEILPKYADKLSDTKKIDFLIWADRTKGEQ